MAATAQDQKMYIGIDVSKNRLDVHIHPSIEVFVVEQNAERLEQLVKRLKDLDLAVIAIEATGGLESMSLAALAAARLPEVGLFKVPLYPRRGPFWVHQAPHRWIKSLKDATSYKPVASYSIVGRAVIRLGLNSPDSILAAPNGPCP